MPYAGSHPDGFSTLAEIQAYLEAFAALVKPPARLGVRATGVRPVEGGYRVDTSEGTLATSNVVIATGLLQQPRIPPFAAPIAQNVVQVPAHAYRNPATLPPGTVIVVGNGQSGCPIAEELQSSGRQVYLSLGSSRRAPPHYRGKPKHAWVLLLSMPTFGADGVAKSAYVADPHGGRSYSPHRFARDGMRLLGHISGAQGNTVTFAPDEFDMLRLSDQSEAEFRRAVDDYIESQGLQAPDEPTTLLDDDGYRQEQLLHLDLDKAGVTSIVWCSGYGFDFRWIQAPVLDESGGPVHERGVPACPGLYFVGMHWRTRPASAFVGGVAGEAEHVAAHIAARAAR